MRNVIHVKRYRMELDLRQRLPSAELPGGFRWLLWSDDLLEHHAQVKFRCFDGETDTQVFPCLGHLVGCRDLMLAIATRPGFCRSATWLVATEDEFVGTVQGLLDSNRFGAIQNLGVVPESRGLGIGRALLLKALGGFAYAGATRALLEVTASNEVAVQMYRRIGFRCTKTIYREVECREAAPASERDADPVGVGL